MTLPNPYHYIDRRYYQIATIERQIGLGITTRRRQAARLAVLQAEIETAEYLLDLDPIEIAKTRNDARARSLTHFMQQTEAVAA